MNWKDLAVIIAPYAPTIGKMLGGLAPFPGGEMLGEWAGGMLARQLGVVPTPEAVHAAVQSGVAQDGTSVVAKLERAETEAVAKWDAMAQIAQVEAQDRTAQSQAINETMRSEIAAGVSWWHWRHLLGYAVLLQVFGLSFPIFKDLWLGNVVNLTATQQLIAAITPIYLGLLALLGYIANDTSRLKETAITGQQRPTVVAAVASKVAGKR